MREPARALALLVRTAWKADRPRTLGLLLEPLSFVCVPVFAWALGVMADGVFRGDGRRVALGVAAITLTRVAWYLGTWTGAALRNRLIEVVGFAFDREIATLMARLPGVEHHERADVLDRLELLRQRQGLLGNALSTLVSIANTVVGAAATPVGLAVVNPWLLLLVIFCLPALPIAAAQERWLDDAEARSGVPFRRARLLRRLTVDRDAGMELRVFGLEDEIVSRLGQAWTEAGAPLLNATRRAALLNAAGDLLFLAGFAGAVLLVLRQALRGQATPGEVVMTVYLAQQARSSIVEPIQLAVYASEALRSAGRMLWLQDYARERMKALGGGTPAPARLRDAIVFENVSFRYPGTDRWALRNVSFHLPAGAVVALVGENGAGKTTVVKLLCRMYEPTEGRILVDGVDLREMDVDAWRARLSAAFQDFGRFELSARESVGVGDLPRAQQAGAVEEALERAGAADVLAALPGGLDTRLGASWEDGVDLSTGQWQKLALGRALMRREPLVVFFDEPTASLDALAEHALFERYAREARAGAARGAVTVLVSHRFSTVRAADLILVIDGGGVAALGAHDELIVRGGLYSELYMLQARAYQQAPGPALQPAEAAGGS
jgi:ATP-binding cassette subfamily B protein